MPQRHETFLRLSEKPNVDASLDASLFLSTLVQKLDGEQGELPLNTPPGNGELPFNS